MKANRTLARAAYWIVLSTLLALGTPVGTAFAQAGREIEIEITDSGFNPAEIVVDVGTTVTWTNVDREIHAVFPESGPAYGDDSGTFGIDFGESFSYTYQQQGEYVYIDNYGDAGLSTVLVRDPESAAADASAPAEQVQDSALLIAAQQGGLPAAIVNSDCSGDGEEVAALNPASVPLSSVIGSERAIPGANSFTTVAVGMDALTAEDHAVVVTGPDGEVVACGEIGGRMTDSGALIVGLHQGSANELGGVVVLTPSDLPNQSNVSLFVVGPQLDGAISTTSAVTPDDGGSGSAVNAKAETAPTQVAGTAPETAVLAYEVAAEDLIEAPNGRTRIVQRIVIPESGTPEIVAATLANVARQGQQDYPQATVSVVFAYRPGDNTESFYTVGSASVSRDGDGFDPGTDMLLSGRDDGRLQVDVVTEIVDDVALETEAFYFPAD